MGLRLTAPVRVHWSWAAAPHQASLVTRLEGWGRGGQASKCLMSPLHSLFPSRGGSKGVSRMDKVTIMGRVLSTDMKTGMGDCYALSTSPLVNPGCCQLGMVLTASSKRCLHPTQGWEEPGPANNAQLPTLPWHQGTV